MYSLLIVDDESMIVDWLYELFKDNEHMDLDVYKAYSGDEALAWMNRTKIDVLLTDIRMPGMDGLQLLEKVRENWPECRVIFLTGYNEFDYVYTAIKYDGVGYLLKTEEDDAIIKAVKNAIDEIEKRIQSQRLIDEAKEQISATLPLLQKEYISDLLQNDACDPKSMKRQFDELNIPLIADAPVLLVVGRMENLPQNIYTIDKWRYFFGLKLIAQQYFSPSTVNFSVMLDNCTVLWFIQPKSLPYGDNYEESDGQNAQGVDSQKLREWERVARFVEGNLDSIRASYKHSYNISVSFVTSTEPVPWYKVSQKLDNLKLLLNSNIGFGTEIIMTDKASPPFNEKSAIIQYSDEMQQARTQLKKISNLENCLEGGQKEDYFTLLYDLTSYLRRATSVNDNYALEIYYSISLVLLSYINRWHLMERLAFKIELYKLTRVDEHVSWKEAVEYLYELSNIIFDMQRNDQEERASKAIARIKQYINDNIHRDLSIVTLAELVHFNPSYLSRLFKQVTGVNLSEYISEAKMNKAKELLGRSKLKIYEVAAAVGFESTSYFNRFFKKRMNMTPQEYRLSLFSNR